MIRQLATEVQARGLAGPKADPRLRGLLKSLTAVDDTIFRPVERMGWAPGAGFGKAVRLHLNFAVLEGLPENWSVTPGTAPDPAVFQSKVMPIQLYTS